jgi:hypothetical protein
MTTVLGLEYASVEFGDHLDKNQTNPKAGLIWDISDTSTLRAAAFRTLQVSSSIKQTISPTQVAGFNQLFDTTIGSEAWRYGIGYDTQIIPNLYGGIELTRRTVTEPIEFNQTIIENDYKQQYHSAYLSWPVYNQYAIGGHYIYDDFERDVITGGVIEDGKPADMNTQTLSLLGKYSSPHGFFAQIEAVHVSQDITLALGSEGTEDMDDEFWLSNVSFGFRFPRRRGIIELDIRNAFDKEFKFQSVDPGSGATLPIHYYPERLVMLRAELWYD